jgi:hypothetical protein
LASVESVIIASSTSFNNTSSSSEPVYKSALFIGLVAGLGGFLVVAVILSLLLFFYVRRAHKTEENTSSEVELPVVKGEEHSPRESVDSTYNDKPVEDVAVSTLVPRQTATVTRPSIARTRFSHTFCDNE